MAQRDSQSKSSVSWTFISDICFISYKRKKKKSRDFPPLFSLSLKKQKNEGKKKKEIETKRTKKRKKKKN